MVALKRTIVLIGMMGAGKSSVGRRLAAKLSVPFRDADAEIEAAAGCTITEIFDRLGEAEFRKGEQRVILRLLAEGPHVLAAGGGAFINETTRAAIQRDGVSVWLRAPLDVLVARLQRRETRPLLKNGDPRAILKELLAVREPIYGEADLVVDTEDGPHAAVVERITAALEARGLLVEP